MNQFIFACAVFAAVCAYATAGAPYYPAPAPLAYEPVPAYYKPAPYYPATAYYPSYKPTPLVAAPSYPAASAAAKSSAAVLKPGHYDQYVVPSYEYISGEPGYPKAYSAPAYKAY